LAKHAVNQPDSSLPVGGAIVEVDIDVHGGRQPGN
jgi:hypothetical protein